MAVNRVARWHDFKPKILNWVSFVRTRNGRWYSLWPFDLLYDNLIYFVAIWYISWLFGIFHGHLVYFMVIWYISWLFGTFHGYLVYFVRFGMMYQEKSSIHDGK
jgi:hypothetical protein